jgi:hypothetical protein
MRTGRDGLSAVDHHCCEEELDVLPLWFACERKGCALERQRVFEAAA